MLLSPFSGLLGFSDRVVARTALFPSGLYRLRFLWTMDICSSSEEGKSYTLDSVMGFGCARPRVLVVSTGPDGLSPFLSRCDLVYNGRERRDDLGKGISLGVALVSDERIGFSVVDGG